LTKGKLVFVGGKIKTRSYDDRDGNKRYITEIIADQVKFLDKVEDQAWFDDPPQSGEQDQRF
jgi:single-strand DNA-binding protein